MNKNSRALILIAMMVFCQAVYAYLPNFYDFQSEAQSSEKTLTDNVNFAEKYIVNSVSCGASCQNWKIEDESNGKSYPGPATEAGLNFKKDSYLMIANPIENYTREGSVEDFPLTFYYLFDNEKIEIILGTQKTAQVTWVDGHPFVAENNCLSPYHTMIPRTFDTTIQDQGRGKFYFAASTEPHAGNAIKLIQGKAEVTYVRAELCRDYQYPKDVKKNMNKK